MAYHEPASGIFNFDTNFAGNNDAIPKVFRKRNHKSQAVC